MVVALPVRERRKVWARGREDEHADALTCAWQERLDDFDINPSGDDEYGEICLDYSDAIERETPATIRAKCEAIRAARLTPRPEKSADAKGGEDAE